MQREGVATDFHGCTWGDESLWPFGVEARVRIDFPTVDIEVEPARLRTKARVSQRSLRFGRAYLA